MPSGTSHHPSFDPRRQQLQFDAFVDVSPGVVIALKEAAVVVAVPEVFLLDSSELARDLARSHRDSHFAGLTPDPDVVEPFLKSNPPQNFRVLPLRFRQRSPTFRCGRLNEGMVELDGGDRPEIHGHVGNDRDDGGWEFLRRRIRPRARGPSDNPKHQAHEDNRDWGESWRHKADDGGRPHHLKRFSNCKLDPRQTTGLPELQQLAPRLLPIPAECVQCAKRAHGATHRKQNPSLNNCNCSRRHKKNAHGIQQFGHHRHRSRSIFADP